MPYRRKPLSQLPWLRGMSHNGRIITLTEPFWAVPFNMITVYAVLYMMELGLSERQVGLTQSALVGAQIVSSLISGLLTDRLGRRRTTLIFDTVSWAAACMVWAFSRSLTGFLIAAILNGINKIVYVSFSCLITEDASSSQRLRNYSGLHFMILAGGLLAPIGGVVVRRMGLVPGTRLLYLVGGSVMMAMFLVRHFSWKEPVGRSSSHWENPFAGLWKAMSYFMGDPQVTRVFLLQTAAQFYQVFKPLFYFAFLRDKVGLSAGVLSLIPMTASLITMTILLGLLPRVAHSRRKGLLTLGFLLGGASLILLVLSIRGSLFLLGASILLDSVSTALMRPLLDSLWADHLQDEGRAKQLAAGNTFFGLVTIPAGIAAAELYRLAPGLPFLAAAGLLLFCALGCRGLLREEDHPEKG